MYEPDPTPQPTTDPIEPNIGVNGWALLWALVGVILFFYHWGRALVFVAGFVLNGTPYALVEAGNQAPDPLHDEDVVFIRRGEPSLEPGQILWVDLGKPQLAKLFLAGPGTVPVAHLANLDRIMPESARSNLVSVTDQQIVVGVGGDTVRDTLGQIVPRHLILGRAAHVILPPHRMRALP